MLTRWGRDLDPGRPLPEHPRPQLVRDTPWLNLNGRWECGFGDGDTPVYDREIVVPFSPEAPLSGVQRQLQPEERLFYRRRFRPPEGPRVLLHFGAVDQQATVFVNGHEVGAHTGGYLPFSVDVTDALEDEENLLEVRVRDWSETRPHARGKQRLDRGQIWYTAQSGIWQTVWLEAVPPTYVERLEITPHGDVLEVAAYSSDGEVHRQVERPERRWSTDDPYLHPFDVTVGDDTVHAYGALREVGTADGRITLNGSPLVQAGVLDQGYWPDGLLTAPSDAAIVHDIQTMKDLGFNLLRKHAKVEPLRWYHHCDRLGMLVWQDVVNGGGRYRALTSQRPARHPVPLRDDRFGLFGRDDAPAREEFREEVRGTVRLLQASPSVVVWTPFNEGWGQFHANDVAAEVKALDPTRLVNHVSGWIDQGGGDIRSFHSYLRPFVLRRRRGDRRAHALTEYGGYSLRVPGHDWRDPDDGPPFGYRHFESAEELAAAFLALHEQQIVLAVRSGLSATVYTQLSDVEEELNGLLTWDREVLKVPAEVVRKVTALLRG